MEEKVSVVVFIPISTFLGPNGILSEKCLNWLLGLGLVLTKLFSSLLLTSLFFFFVPGEMILNYRCLWIDHFDRNG